MGGGSSKKAVKGDDTPPPAAAAGAETPPKADAKRDAKAKKRFATVEKKIAKETRTRVDEAVSDGDEEAAIYDSDLDKELEADAEALSLQEDDDEHKILTIQDRARADALQWSTQVLPPSDFVPRENSEYKPEENVGLDFVHGFRGWDCLSNLKYTVTEEIAYFAAALGIIYEPKLGRQKHYQGPATQKMREVICLCMHPAGSIVATAERSLKANIFIWDLSTLATLRVLSWHSAGVSAMAFSKDGKRLASAGLDADHTVCVWEWKNDKKIDPLCKTTLKTAKIFSLGFNPRDDVLTVCGVSMVEFMRVGLSRTGQRVIEHLPGVFSVTNRATHGVSPTMLCCAFTKTEFTIASNLKNAVEGLCLTGSDIGNIYLWKREEQIDMIVAAHKGSVYGLATFVNGFVSGGKDGKIRSWNNDLEPQRAYDVSAAALSEVVIKSIDHKSGLVLVGTASSEIFELDLETGDIELLARGHSAPKVWAVASHPTKALYGSVGDDAVLRLWDLVRRREWKHKQLEMPGRSIHFSPDGRCVAVGHSNGSWSVHRLDSMDEVISTKDRKKNVYSIKFSPNGRYLAVGSEDCMIDLYDCVSDYDWMGTLQGHTYAIMHMDWSADSHALQSSGEGLELLSWDVDNQTLMPGYEASRDIEWITWTHTIGWPTQGFIAAGRANTDVCRSLSDHLVATANTDGSIRLYRYPCVVSGAEAVECSGHVGAAKSCTFSFDDSFLLTCSDGDRCIFQWRVSGEGDIGFDQIDDGGLASLEVGGNKDNKVVKDGFEQSRLDKRNARLEAEKVPLMDPGKDVPQREGKGKGKDAAKGAADEPTPGDDDSASGGILNPGQPDDLPEVDEEVEESDIVKDSDIERENQTRWHRGPSGAKEDKKIDDGLDVLPIIGQPLFAVKSAAMAIPPTNYKKPDDAADTPLSGLQMEFIHGSRGHDARSTMLYTGRGEIVFVAGATGVVYNAVQHTQKFFNGHTDDIICLALHPDVNKVATGQVGKKALLCVWDTYTMQTLTILRGFHDHGICCVGFSSKGDRVVSVGMDADHSIAVWNWQTGTKIASATGHTYRIMCAAFNPSDDSIVTCGVNHVKFWTVQGRLLRGKSGTFSQGSKQQAMCSLTISKKGRTYSGSEQGEIYRWKNQEVDTLVKAHDGMPVFCLWVCRDGLASGGKDGKVMVWSLNLKPLVTFDMRSQSTGLERTRIRSVCWLAKTILVGTIHSEVFEIDIESASTTALLHGHAPGKVNGLQCHPSKRIFVTGGEDKTVRIWDMDTRKQMNIKTLDGPVYSVAISLDGTQIAAGLQEGKLVIMKARSLRATMERKDRKKALLEMKYSTNGKFLAVGSEDGFIDLYDVLSDYEWIGTCQGHKTLNTIFEQAGVIAIDWSNDSKQMQSDDSLGLHMYWDVESTKEILIAAEIRDVDWSSWTCVQGWPVQGIGPKFQGSTGINTSCRSSFGDSIATGDDWGVVKLFRFPCITPGARCKRYGGHSSRVGKIRFSFEEKTVVSTGLVDGLIIQWRYLSAGKLLEVEQVASDDEDELEFEVKATVSDENVDSDVENELATRFGRGNSEVRVDKTGMIQVKSQRMVTGKETVIAGSVETKLNVKSGIGEEEDEGHEVRKDWRKPMDADEAPYNVLQCEHIYGYRGHDCRNNLMYNGDGRMVYMVAAVAVVYDKSHHVQHFYSAHTDDVICIAMHPDKDIVATGQVGKIPIIQVWSSKTMQTLVTLRGFHEMGVASVAFSKDGTKLASVGLDLDHSIAIWDWRRGSRVATSPGHTDKIFEARFNPVDDVLVTCGVHHIKFWTLIGDNQLKSRRGVYHTKPVYGQEGLQQTMLCVAFTDAGLALSGAQSGDIFLWKGCNLEWQFEQAHTAPIFAISTYPDGFVSGGKDGRVRLWSGLDPVKVFDFSATSVASTVPTRIRSACWKDGFVLVGTMSNEIFEVDERTMTQRLIVQSHTGAEVWGLDTHPRQSMFITGGDDRTVRVFKVSSRKPVMVRELEEGVRCVAYNNDGTQIAAGLVNGKIMILDYKKLEEVCSRHTRDQIITDLKFSPDGRYLASTCLDGALDVYDAMVDFDLVGTASTRVGCGLTHLDWSADGMFIQTDNTNREHQYWDSSSVLEKMDGEDALSRTEWHTWTCVYGWSVLGLTPKFGELVGINACCRSNKGEVLAVANDFGIIRLFRFPSPYQGCRYKRYAGHSSLITNCRFTHDDKYLISIGGMDRSIFQWEHIAD